MAHDNQSALISSFPRKRPTGYANVQPSPAKPGGRVGEVVLPAPASRLRAGLSGERNPVVKIDCDTRFYRLGRACPGHPRLSCNARKTWMPGTRAGTSES